MNSFKLQKVMVIIVTIVAITAFSMSIKIIEDQTNNSYKSINNIVDSEISECYYDCNNQQELAKMKTHQIETKVDKEIQQMITKREAEKKAAAIANEKKKKDQLKKQAQKKQSVQVANVSRGESRKSEWKVFEATHYIALCDTGCTGITANGTDVRNSIYSGDLRVIAVDPKVIPLNSIVEVSTPYDTFYAIAADTGGLIDGYLIDILVGTESEARELGRVRVQLRIIK